AILGRVIQTDEADIHRQMLFERADDDLKDALDVLPLADRPGDLLQQVEARQLGLYFGFPEPAVRDVPGDLGRADDAALAVPEGGGGDGKNAIADVLGDATRPVMINR